MESNPAKFIAVVQTKFSTRDFLLQHFVPKVDSYLTQVRSKAYESSGQSECEIVVLFPELIGAWLIVNCDSSLTEKSSLTSAMVTLIVRRPFSFLRHLLGSFLRSGLLKFSLMQHIQRAAYFMVAPQSLKMYFEIFSEAARKFGCTLVAGSTFMQEVEDIPDETTESPLVTCPRITDPYKLYNTSFVFDKSGRVVSKYQKCHTIADEKFLDRGDPSKWKLTPSPVGSFVVLVCADTWYPASYEAVKKLNAEIVLAPAFSSPGECWNKPWTGYSGFCAPLDVTSDDIGEISLGMAWTKYSLAGRLRSCDARLGAIAYDVGHVWEMTAEGESFICSQENKILSSSPSASEILLHRIDSPALAVTSSEG